MLFGAAACLEVEGWVGAHVLASWQAGRSSLREGSTAAVVAA
ncbi:hypothetical protein BC477_18255 [Clavibacter michiganensis subsp. michiganensis]|uniref:Uncharacterized protein n=1 Tax=Clavibacter michiganensis subsp. michiganensis TaxID=33013 RepID=A0A251XG42_CLAMM|nr:hypothetical protein BC477_18255 [Clavibacter michiganensis subsp. michiganensis]OUE01425.1 hypothetical protein CMMCAS07_14040 [Clavibacter michiganensis subsp. michiganensis]